MIKIFRYECRRLLWNKVFWCLLAILLWYGWQLLTGEVILGVANTAPFSPWSFGHYLSRTLPLLCLGEMFFLTFFTSPRERRAAALTDATPADRRRYALVRCCAALLGTALLALLTVLLGFGFYWRLFGWTDFAALLAPALLALVPLLLFFLGAGWYLGRVHPALVFVLMAVPFLLVWVPLPPALDLMGGSFFAEYPRTLGVLDPALSVPAAVLVSRLALSLLGVLLTVKAAPANRGGLKGRE